MCIYSTNVKLCKFKTILNYGSIGFTNRTKWKTTVRHWQFYFGSLINGLIFRCLRIIHIDRCWQYRFLPQYRPAASINGYNALAAWSEKTWTVYVLYRIDFKIAYLTYGCLNGFDSDYLRDTLRSPELSRWATNRLIIQTYRTESYSGRSFKVYAPRLWNKLPPSVKSSSHHPSQFRTLNCLKQTLIEYCISR